MRTSLCVAIVAVVTACGGEPPGAESGEILDTSDFTTLRSGTLMAQDEPATSGTVRMATSPEGERYLVLEDDFRTAFHTGSVALFLAASTRNLDEQRDEDVNSVSPRIGRTSVIGGQSFAIPDGLDDSAFTAVVVYCEPVGVNFGAAVLQ